MDRTREEQLAAAIEKVLQPAPDGMAVPQIMEALPVSLRSSAGEVAAICEHRFRHGSWLAWNQDGVGRYALQHRTGRSKRGQVPFELPARLAVIAEDLETAIADACDAGLPHDSIKALAAACASTRRAARGLQA